MAIKCNNFGTKNVSFRASGYATNLQLFTLNGSIIIKALFLFVLMCSQHLERSIYLFIGIDIYIYKDNAWTKFISF